MIAGAIAGSATVLITNPIWVINTRMTARKSDDEQQSLPGGASKPAKKASTFSTLMELLRTEGPKALFAGVLPALVLVINPILQYTIFEQLKNVVERRRRMTPKDAFYLGALGKILATSITYPYITIKSRMHVASKDGPKESLNGSLKRIIREEGWKGLYKGESTQHTSRYTISKKISLGDDNANNVILQELGLRLRRVLLQLPSSLRLRMCFMIRWLLCVSVVLFGSKQCSLSPSFSLHSATQLG